MTSPAVFLDRDGTLVHPRHYPSRPEDLLPYGGVALELQHLRQEGFRLVVITNQSGIARGYFTEEDLERMHDHLQRELQKRSSPQLPAAHLDRIYYCPHHEDGIIPRLTMACKCRKPQPGMLLQAAVELDLDLAASWFVGDILDDVEAGNRAGCRTILVDLGTEAAPTESIRRPHFVARDTVHALRIIRAFSSADLTYLPASWHVAVPRETVPVTGGSDDRLG